MPRRKSFKVVSPKGLFKDEFVFYKPKPNADAWYCFDHAESENDSGKLIINADRDVYVTFVDKNGKEHAGYLSEADDEDKFPIPDNFPVDFGATYYFHSCRAGYYL